MSEDQYLGPDQPLPAQRSTFLTVLCVLTFLGSAYGIFSGMTTFMTADKVKVMTTQANKDIERERARADSAHTDSVKQKDPAAKFFLDLADSAKNITTQQIKMGGIGGAIASVFTLLGAILMWRLNRKGFYLYVLGIIITVVLPFIIFGTENKFAMLGAVFPAFFGVIFIAMYAFNLKDMK